MHASHGHLWISSADEILLLDQDCGPKSKSILVYPPKRRVLPELPAMSEDTSPYAQTGYSIYSIQCVKNNLMVVHDIERCAPVLADCILLH